MATASNPPPPHHSPRPRRSPTPRASDSSPRASYSSPWTQIVRGIESDFIASSTATVTSAGEIEDQIVEDYSKSVSEAGDVAVLSSSASNEDSSDSLENGKKPVWKKPAPSDVSPEASDLIGVAAWPALSESTKASSKSSSTDSLKNLSEGSSSSSSVPQLTGMASSSSQRQGNNTNTNPIAQTNHTIPTRQRSFRRGNGSGSGNPSNNMTTNGGLSLAPPSQGFGLESPPNNTGRPANPESLSEANPHREAGGRRGGFVPQSSSGGEHQQRNSYRRGLGGPHPRGDGSHYHNHGGWRDQDRGNQDRIPHRNFGGRGSHMQPQRGSSRPFVRGPPHTNTSYVPPPIAVHPSFGTPMVYPSPEVFYFPGPHQDPYRTGSMVPPMGPVFYPFFDPLLHTKIINQIEFYFSTENLVRDTYLRKNMDEQGWVSIKLIAGFQKVSQLTDNIQLILAALQASRLLEIEGEKLRLRDDWQKWIIPPLVQQIDVSSSQSTQESGQDQEMLAVHLQNVALGERSVRNVDHENHPSRSSH